MLAFIEWFLTNTIYGISGVAVVIAGISYVFRKYFLWLPNHFAIGGIVLIILLFSVPTYTRYKFHEQVNDLLSRSPHVRVIRKEHWGDISEPLTWFFDFIGSIELVGLNSFPDPGYTRLIMQYEGEPILFKEDPDCEDNTISISEPDIKGVFRYTSWGIQMKPEDIILYCDTDWAPQKEALRDLMLETRSKKQAPQK